MKRKHLLIFTVIVISSFSLLGQKQQNHRSIFIHIEYQCLNYDYMTIGIGFQPKNNFPDIVNKHPKLSFRGYTINFSKKLQNSDWGLSIQTCMYSATASGPLGIGLEANYKSINANDHICFKPFIGLSFPIISIMYGYNIDFYTIKSERLNQNEIIISARIPVFTKKK